MCFNITIIIHVSVTVISFASYCQIPTSYSICTFALSYPAHTRRLGSMRVLSPLKYITKVLAIIIDKSIRLWLMIPPVCDQKCIIMWRYNYILVVALQFALLCWCNWFNLLGLWVSFSSNLDSLPSPRPPIFLVVCKTVWFRPDVGIQGLQETFPHKKSCTENAQLAFAIISLITDACRLRPVSWTGSDDEMCTQNT